MHRFGKSATAAAALIVFASFSACAPSDSSQAGGSAADTSTLPKPTFTPDGQLERPMGYREWVYVGTPLTPNELNPPEAPFPEFHNVYIHPDDWAHWKETGEFPDSTVMVKELALVGSTQAVSGNGYFMGEFSGLEATIKDSQRFADEPGYWAYFTFGHSYPLAEAAPAQPAGACNACHEASAADDWVFTQYYPVLTAAKGTGATGGENMPGSAAEGMTGDTEAADAFTTVEVSAADAVPTSADELFAYLQSGGYKTFAAEDEPHTSTGPHPSPDLQQSSTVRAYFNGPLDASLKAGSGSHPGGSAAVKEFFGDDGQVSGWAVAVKTQNDSGEGQNWYWYEVLSTTDGSNPVAAELGVALCWGCHTTGRDFVLSKYPS